METMLPGGHRQGSWEHADFPSRSPPERGCDSGLTSPLSRTLTVPALSLRPGLPSERDPGASFPGWAGRYKAAPTSCLSTSRLSVRLPLPGGSRMRVRNCNYSISVLVACVASSDVFSDSEARVRLWSPAVLVCKHDVNRTIFLSSFSQPGLLTGLFGVGGVALLGFGVLKPKMLGA